MTDLKREQALIDELYAGDKGLFYWHDEDTRRIANALATARREARAEALEEAARVVEDYFNPETCGPCAAAIRALKER